MAAFTVLNLAPIRSELCPNLRAKATVAVGSAPHHRFAIWRTADGDTVSGVPELDFDLWGGAKPGPPAFCLPPPLMEAIARELLAAYYTDFTDLAPYVAMGDPAAHPDNNVGWRQNKDRAAPVQPKSATNAAPVHTLANPANPRVNPNAENETASRKQIEYLTALGYKGAMPTNKAEASALIDQLVTEKKDREAREKAAQPAMGI